ncbi:hypothetical protein BJ508DRAFT_410857 [Ascobolus immersus RN42]|uniref:Uncharacterized protein n=1 Tax=Ascobolus immersus RN42 TaxID=1160509 RepID=A0A3N4IRH8_ASCIM|nr:hypothetical protein BJ508DRAFT_410857 [Ascobolus immersus RN42]
MANPFRTPSSTNTTPSTTGTSPSILPLHPTQKHHGMSNIPASAPASMAHHREILQRKMNEQKDSKFTSPTDEILSPCSQRLKEYKSKKATRLTQTLFKSSKAGVPMAKNLFAKRSSEKLAFGSLDSIATNTGTGAASGGQKSAEDVKMGGYDL